MADLGPGPRRWHRAQHAYDAAVEQRNRDIAKALKQKLGSAQEIADAYGVTRAWVYRIALEEGRAA
jgi:DNA invertase Pin-like site-specific DNA recombinase